MLDPEVTITHIRENIRQKILDAGYATIEKFAYENGLTKSTITRAINGSRNPRLITLIEIANGLDINLSELLDLHQIEHNQVKKTKNSKLRK
ncbi:MAG: helix-turn-helix transcriptional regulator [Fibrobacteraceae bacterium]|nr:helix-turn-helix transcriptional regulator [Fibrobacteraceae bacterium]